MALLLVTARAAEPEKSVVQIFVASQLPVWDAPWRFESIRRSSGTGFLIKGKRILTNAHVVSWGRQILVKKYQDPRPYQARVVFVGHDRSRGAGNRRPEFHARDGGSGDWGTAEHSRGHGAADILEMAGPQIMQDDQLRTMADAADDIARNLGVQSIVVQDSSAPARSILSFEGN